MTTDQRIRFRHTRQPITAVEWRVGPADDFQNGVSEIRIETRGQRDGSTLYAVTQRGWTANKDGEWEYEPIPSSRDDDYLARCRWDDWEDAALMADRMLADESATDRQLPPEIDREQYARAVELVRLEGLDD